MAVNVAPFQSTDEFTMAGFNGKLSAINSGVDNEITSALSGFARIETGSYTGTGKYGESNPNTLTFGFEPKVIFIYTSDSSEVAILLKDQTIARNNQQGTSSAQLLRGITWIGNTVSWYSSDSADQQRNEASKQYTYIAIG